MAASADGDLEHDPFMLHLRSRVIEARRRLGIPISNDSKNWPTALSSPPSPSEFCELIDRHVPALIEGCISDREGLGSWKDSRYLIARMGSERKVTVALTPDGAADDLVALDDSINAFALPLEEQMTFDELFNRFNAQSQHVKGTSYEVAYLQSQNSNLEATGSGDLSPLLADLMYSSSTVDTAKLHGDLRWATEAVGCAPEATNIWIGTSASRTSMHRDHYENLFTVIRGWKEFTVFPPAEGCFLCDDEEFPVYTYTRAKNGTLNLKQIQSATTRWIPIDPTQPKDSKRNRRYTYKDLNLAPPQPALSMPRPSSKYGYALPPLKIKVHEGQTLYLPSGWYHHVSQQQDSQMETIGGIKIDLGVCLCINWWYEITDDMALRLAEMDLTTDA